MCGIIGYVGKNKCIPVIIDGLKTLEYRGYDSAGIAYFKNNKINIIKEKGKIENLEKLINNDEESYLGIGHTRWATHGVPCKKNSHPHQVGHVTIVHNGIIENYMDIRKESLYKFKSETDTEVIAYLINKIFEEENFNILKTLKKVQKNIIGSYALGILFDTDKEHLYAMRKDSPLIIGVGDDENFIASDVPAILKYTNKYVLLDNYDIAILSSDNYVIYNKNKKVDREEKVFEFSSNESSKKEFKHYMLKEIYEQPNVLKKTLNQYIEDNKFINKNLNDLSKYKSITIVGCGSAYHAGIVGKYLIEDLCNIPVDVEIASENRYKKNFYRDNSLFIVISQSGETADTLASLRKAKENNIDTLAIVNVEGSSIAREADKVLYTKAGPEIAVATTKGYTTQILVLMIIALKIAKDKRINIDKELNALSNIYSITNKVLKDTSVCEEIAKKIHKSNDIFFLGRKIDYALCLEASLKLKEISYIHSEAYPAGELKHGTISLIEENTPVLSLITDKDIALKTISNIKEVRARGAYNVIITNIEIDNSDNLFDKIINVESNSSFTDLFASMIYFQLIAYYTALINGCDIDKPRNLAKSVTVE